ncbi:MAG: class I SAM-dependent methyltransferase [Candidatus Peribacteria bacterium]|nr:MAG: class I SAM-dependent methyltransferase [Candidatus Peribacteria bacterium]
MITLFLETNSQINLSSIRDAHGVYHKHILDSLELIKVLPLESGKTLADVGTG